VFQIWRDLLHGLRSYCWETARRSIRPNFCVYPVGKTMRWIKKWSSYFDGLDELYHRAKFGEDRTMCAGCRCENVVFVCFLVCSFVTLRVRSTVRFDRGVYIVRTSIVLPFIGRFWRGFQLFFRRDCLFRCAT